MMSACGSTDQAAPARGLAVGRGDFARLQQLFEATQILLDLGLRILPQQLGEGGGQGGINNAPGARGHWGGAARGGLSEILCAGPGFHQVLTKRSPNMMANWVLASAHSRGGIFHC